MLIGQFHPPRAFARKSTIKTGNRTPEAQAHAASRSLSGLPSKPGPRTREGFAAAKSGYRAALGAVRPPDCDDR